MKMNYFILSFRFIKKKNHLWWPGGWKDMMLMHAKFFFFRGKIFIHKREIFTSKDKTSNEGGESSIQITSLEINLGAYRCWQGWHQV